MNVLEIDSVVHSFKRQKVLTDVFLKCQTGEIIGILGKNGSGKSTLLNVIFGMLKADSFTMHINNRYVEDPMKDTFFACLPEKSFLPGDITVKRCINMFLDFADRKSRLLSDDKIGPLADRIVNQLSSGERRYLEVSLVLYLDADFVLLDEPFTELEPIYRAKIKSIIHTQLEHKCFIVTDHNYRNIIDISTRLFLLQGGELEEIENMDELISRGYLPQETQRQA